MSEKSELAELRGLVETQQKLLEELAGKLLRETEEPLSRGNIVDLIKTHGASDRRRQFVPLTGKERTALDKVDPLSWIDEKTTVVRFVTRLGSTPIRHPWIASSGSEIPKLKIKRSDCRIWLNNPYRYPGQTPQDIQSNYLMNRDYGRMELTRRIAEDSWLGRDPMPVEVVVEPENFEGMHFGEPQGKDRLASGIALRERTRDLLQRCKKMIWLDTDFYWHNWTGDLGPKIPEASEARPWHDLINPREPNPYHTGCVGAVNDDGVSPYAGGFGVNRGMTGDVERAARLASIRQ